MFLPHYDSGTFLSHLAEGEYGFDIIGSNCIDMYQMYVAVPTVRHGIPYVGVGLVYLCLSLHIGDIEDCTIFLKMFFTHYESSVNMAPSQAFFLRKRRELGPLCQPLPSWICINTITLCPGVVDPERAQSRAIYSTQVLTFHMMLATKHHFEGIQEKAMVFIPLEFRDLQDTRSQWSGFLRIPGWCMGMGQVTSDHVASHYTMLAIQYAAKPAGGAPQNHVSIVTPHTECSQTIDLPSARISNKGGATTRPKGSVHHVKVDPGSVDPPSPWKD